MNIGIVYLQKWLNLGSTYVLHWMMGIHLFLAQVLHILVSSLQSLHTATIFYLCILYIQEAISMATEVDKDVIIA